MKAVITGTLKNSSRVCAVLSGSYDNKAQALRWLDHYKALSEEKSCNTCAFSCSEKETDICFQSGQKCWAAEKPRYKRKTLHSDLDYSIEFIG